MKSKDRVSISDFIRFIGQVHHQHKLIRDSIERGETINAIADSDYMEVLLCDWARDLSCISAQHWQTATNCASEIVANDLSVKHYDALTVHESSAMQDKIVQTISRFFQ